MLRFLALFGGLHVSTVDGGVKVAGAFACTRKAR